MAPTLMHNTSEVSGFLPRFSTDIKFTTEPPVIKTFRQSPEYSNGIKSEVIF